MARRGRVHYEGAFYHIIARGNNKSDIFEDDYDKKEYLLLATKYVKKFDAKLFAYVIMDNHVHLLIQVGEIPLSKIMQLIQQTFTMYYNRKYKQTGHVFEQRYKAILCDKDAYLLMLIRYIHQNPVRAGIAGLEYPWSSHDEYNSGINRFCEVNEGLKYIESDPACAIGIYKDFVSILDEEIKEKKVFEFEPDEIIQESLSIDVEKKTIEEVFNEIEREFGHTVQEIMGRQRNNSMKKLKAHLIQKIIKTTQYNQRDLATHFKVSEMMISRYANLKV